MLCSCRVIAQRQKRGTKLVETKESAPQSKRIPSRSFRQSAQISSGRAVWYQHSGRTASGEIYNPNGLTAAHNSLPLGTRVRVVNRGNGRSVVVRINDRTNRSTQGKNNYVIDLSRGSARKLGIEGVSSVALYRAQ
ncbi:rare lipoprotein A [Methylobacterium sp. 4-46]|nr:rare lipoprotein A [Methylobacterium sp. 4-46]